MRKLQSSLMMILICMVCLGGLGACQTAQHTITVSQHQNCTLQVTGFADGQITIDDGQVLKFAVVVQHGYDTASVTVRLNDTLLVPSSVNGRTINFSAGQINDDATLTITSPTVRTIGTYAFDGLFAYADDDPYTGAEPSLGWTYGDFVSMVLGAQGHLEYFDGSTSLHIGTWALDNNVISWCPVGSDARTMSETLTPGYLRYRLTDVYYAGFELVY